MQAFANVRLVGFDERTDHWTANVTAPFAPRGSRSGPVSFSPVDGVMPARPPPKIVTSSADRLSTMCCLCSYVVTLTSWLAVIITSRQEVSIQKCFFMIIQLSNCRLELSVVRRVISLRCVCSLLHLHVYNKYTFSVINSI